jgi:hypothetical protein
LVVFLAGFFEKNFVILFFVCMIFAGFAFAVVPNPGHSISAIDPPTGCGPNQFLKLNAAGTGWECGTGSGDTSQWTTVASAIYYNGGNVGIGTASPQAKLHVVGAYIELERTDGYDPMLVIKDSGPTGDAADATVLSYYPTLNAAGLQGGQGWGNPTRPLALQLGGGNVGIGTASPQAKLHVVDSSAYIKLERTDGQDPMLVIKDSGPTGDAGDVAILSYIPWANAAGLQGGPGWGNGTRPLALQAGGGNVGIGTASPQAKLHVVDSSAYIKLERTDGQDPMLVIKDSSGYGDADDLVTLSYMPTSNAAGLQAGRGWGNPTRPLSLQPSGGNVGIGTLTPTVKLDVAGEIKGTQLCIGNDCRGAWPTGGSGGSGTVTSVGTGAGLTGGTITTAGTIKLIDCASGQILKSNGANSWSCAADATSGGGGGNADTVDGFHAFNICRLANCYWSDSTWVETSFGSILSMSLRYECPSSYMLAGLNIFGSRNPGNPTYVMDYIQYRESAANQKLCCQLQCG